MTRCSTSNCFPRSITMVKDDITNKLFKNGLKTLSDALCQNSQILLAVFPLWSISPSSKFNMLFPSPSFIQLRSLSFLAFPSTFNSFFYQLQCLHLPSFCTSNRILYVRPSWATVFTGILSFLLSLFCLLFLPLPPTSIHLPCPLQSLPDLNNALFIDQFHFCGLFCCNQLPHFQPCVSCCAYKSENGISATNAWERSHTSYITACE